MSSKPAATGDEQGGTSLPRAVIHKQILEAAEARPDATIETLATAVSGASERLVERVLDEYGDPAEADLTEQAPGSGVTESGTASEKSNANGSPDDADRVPDFAELTDKQQEIITAIYEHPDATQRDLASLLDLSGSTVSVRANSVPGFDWENRQDFATTMIENNSDYPADTGSADDSTEARDGKQDDLAARLDRLEEALAARHASPLSDPELAHKVVRACMKSDHITEDEELRIIAAVLGTDGCDR